MRLPSFQLLDWLAAYETATPPIRCNLAGSAGPVWKFGELLDLNGGALRVELETMPTTYAPTEGTKRLREQIAKLHAVDPEWVVVTLGASEAISLLLCVVSEPGMSVALPAPGYPATELMALAWGLKARHYRLPAQQQFRQDAESVLAAVDASTRLVVVNSPHNPTGTVMQAQQMRELATELSKRSIPLVSDEVFHRVYFGAEQPTAAATSNIIVVGDMSKSLSLPGLRVGWLIDADAKRRRRIIEARGIFSISGSPMLEAVSVAALEARTQILERAKKNTSANLSALERFIVEFSSTLNWVKPEGGTLAFPWLVDDSDARPLCEAWAKAGVLVAPGDCFGMPQHMRMGFGSAEPQAFEVALAIMGKVLTERIRG
jgi:aspartate/methionine/tyrosine aminotransferase